MNLINTLWTITIIFIIIYISLIGDMNMFRLAVIWFLGVISTVLVMILDEIERDNL